MAGRSSSTAATRSTPPQSAPPGSSTRESGGAAPAAADARRVAARLMQALILVGGEGTRLRPLTSLMPKPIVPLVDRPFMAFMLEWLRATASTT